MFETQYREEFMERILAGEELECPCCMRKARIWRLYVHGTLASMLVRLYRKSKELHGRPDEWVHIEAFKPATRTGNDFSIVKHWKLAEPKAADEDEDKNSSGMWRLTCDGVLWVTKHSTIIKYANIFDNECQSYEGNAVTIVDALGKKFSYEEIIAG